MFSWMFLLAEDDPTNPASAVKAAGLGFECIPVSVPADMTKQHACKIIESLEKMEKPSMVRCHFLVNHQPSLIFLPYCSLSGLGCISCELHSSMR